jgi:hypothetical protein
MDSSGFARRIGVRPIRHSSVLDPVPSYKTQARVFPDIDRTQLRIGNASQPVSSGLFLLCNAARCGDRFSADSYLAAFAFASERLA